MILNTKGTDSTDIEPGLVDFLHYVSDSTERQLSAQTDARLRRLHEVIESIRRNLEMETAYMKAETREREIIADAKAEGRMEGRIEDLKNLMGTYKWSIKQAMEALKIPEAEWPEYINLIMKQ